MEKTKIKSIFLFSLLLILIVSSSSSSSSNWVPRFDIYMLAMQWDPATCSDTTLTHQPCPIFSQDKFSIRALWPIRYPSIIVGHCGDSSFNPDILGPIEFDLHKNWPNLLTGDNQQLWEDEWRNHGSCGEERLDQLQYFTFALNSFSQYNFLSILANNNIRPDRRNYLRGNVEAAIARAIGFMPAIFCNINNLTNSRQLHQIRLCYNRDTRNIINCWAALGNCGQNFHWFPYMRTLYSHFQVALQWQPATCVRLNGPLRCVQPPENIFSINGLWPSTANNAILGPCSGSNFDIDRISPLEARLKRGWPDLIRGENERIWENEWRNRGTCSEDQFGQLQFFNFGLHVYESNDISRMLRNNNITPNGERYRRVDIENAIITSNGRRPILVCNLRRTNSTTFNQLHQIILCYDDFGRQIQDCHGTPPIGLTWCPEEFNWFP